MIPSAYAYIQRELLNEGETMAGYRHECGHCGVYTEMNMHGEERITGTHIHEVRQAAFSCNSCRMLSLATARTRTRDIWHGNWDEAEWLPPTVPKRTFQSAPKGIQDCADEALALRSLGYYRASVLLAGVAVRATSNEVRRETGEDDGRRNPPWPIAAIGRAGYIPPGTAHGLDRSLRDVTMKANRPQAIAEFGSPLRVSDEDAEKALTIMTTILGNVWDAKAAEKTVHPGEHTDDEDDASEYDL